MSSVDFRNRWILGREWEVSDEMSHLVGAYPMYSMPLASSTWKERRGEVTHGYRERGTLTALGLSFRNHVSFELGGLKYGEQTRSVSEGITLKFRMVHR